MTTIRAMRWWDIEAVVELERECFPNDTWSVEQFWHELAQPTRRYFVAVDDVHIAGYAGVFVAAPDSDVQTLAVGTRFRGQGTARALMDALVTSAHEAGATSMLLEVRADNHNALRLYRSLSFEEISHRRSYYPDGTDAVIMRRRPLVEQREAM